MSMVITHNISAINTQRNLAITNRQLGKSLEKLSSGYRINVGADGPADLIISEQLRAQNVGLERAVRNTQEAVNVLGIAEGALNEMNEILKKMRALALHAANNGITSPIQVAADQAEVDSGIQTIDRIANTTKYSDQLLLNGSKSLVYDRLTFIKGTQQNALLDVSQSRLDQVFKRSGVSIGITFTGSSSPNATTGMGVVDFTKEARKAYFEIDSATAGGDINSTNATLTKSQSFILTGTKGSRLFNFDVGATMGQIANAINNVADSTGVQASLIFASDQTSVQALTAGTAATLGGTTARSAGNVMVSNNYTSGGTQVITAYTTTASNVSLGYNTDSQGRLFIKVIDNSGNYEVYKDASLSAESKVAIGRSGTAITAVNNSGLSGLTLTIAANTAGHVAVINTQGLEGNQNDAATIASVAYSGSFATAAAAAGSNQWDQTRTFISGVELGKNTDAEGKIYIKWINTAASQATVYAYKDARMADSDLVAVSQASQNLTVAHTVILSEVKNAEGTAGTGLAIALSTNTAGAFVGTAGATGTGVIQLTNLGVRIASEDYGSNAYVRIQQDAGTIWQYYSQPDSATPTFVDASKGGVSVQQNGQDATLTVNGQKVITNGLDLELSTQDVTGTLRFNSGKSGTTTIAQVGYTEGSIATMAKSLTVGTGNGAVPSANSGAIASYASLSGYLNNAGHVTLETLGNFRGGMQFQLGEGAGDQERTVYGIQSMAVANLGKVKFTEQFDPQKAVIETKTLTLQNVLGGGLAALGNDPVKALAIIDKAIQDVSNLRARLGATQANLLQTNANSLKVAIENIAKTESAIRDTDIATETTEFTKNQILISAGTAMLAQANTSAQNVLQLLG